MSPAVANFTFLPGAALRRAAALLCCLLLASGALELHNLANHHSAIEVGGAFEPTASHPRIPHHLDRSQELREPACATCALQAQARGIRPDPAAPVAPAELLPQERPADATPDLAASPSSVSPRGPPAG